jgi:hypothetical protein
MDACPLSPNQDIGITVPELRWNYGASLLNTLIHSFARAFGLRFYGARVRPVRASISLIQSGLPRGRPVVSDIRSRGITVTRAYLPI